MPHYFIMPSYSKESEWEPSKPRPKDAHIIWDWNNAPLPLGYDISTLLTKIQEGLHKHDPLMTIRTVTACGDVTTLAIKEKYADMERIGEERCRILENDERVRTFKVPPREVTCPSCDKSFPLEHVYYSRVEMIDEACHTVLAREMRFLNFNHPPPCYVLLISTNKDFENSMVFMANRKYKVLLSSPDVNTCLAQHSQEFWLWEKLILGEGPSEEKKQRASEEQQGTLYM